MQKNCAKHDKLYIFETLFIPRRIHVCKNICKIFNYKFEFKETEIMKILFKESKYKISLQTWCNLLSFSQWPKVGLNIDLVG